MNIGPNRFHQKRAVSVVKTNGTDGLFCIGGSGSFLFDVMALVVGEASAGFLRTTASTDEGRPFFELSLFFLDTAVIIFGMPEQRLPTDGRP